MSRGKVAARKEAGGAAAELEVVTTAPAQRPAPPPAPGPRKPRPRSPRTPLPAVYVVAISALLSVSGLALWGVLYAYVLSSIQERRTQHELHDTFLRQLADGTAPIEGSIATGSPVAMLQIPRIGLRNLMVVEGTSSPDLEAGPDTAGTRRCRARPAPRSSWAEA